MASRIDLQNKLEEILGSRNVYFQPPENFKLNYPCITYKLNKVDTKKANNKNYKKDVSYNVTLVHKDPDNDIKDKLLELPYCSLNTFFCAENLNHYVYQLYF